ncbi:MAG: 4-(cytidine 5'-diphospho)-2-C-methyl-D-erythritol kinase, partial [Hyphomicrobiales bacterium]
GLESGGNLVLRAARAFRERVPGALLGDFHLRKDLPVASGIGGGSADAAAALRLLARANPGALDGAALAEIALGIGSDVPACLFARATVMAGRGESLAPLAGLPPAHILLVNPGVPVSSREVFARLDAPSPPRPRPDRAGVPAFPDSRRLAGYVRGEGNDLLPAAREIAPVIPAVIGEISAQAGCLAASLSGSGATCFGLFAEAGEAHAAALRIAGAHPGWWAVHAELS